MTAEEKVEQIYEDVGGCGFFQVFAFFAISWGMSVVCFFEFQIGYLIQKPSDYVCSYKSETDMPSCTVQNICDDSVNGAFSSWEADPNSEKTLQNRQ